MPHIKFNWVDVLFVTLLIRICYVGFKNGLLPEFFRFFGLLGAFIISFNNYTALSDFLSNHARWAGAKPDIISFLSIFLFILFIFKVFAIIASTLLVEKDLSRFNRSGALVLSCGRGILLVSLIYVLFVNGPFEYLSRSARDRSFCGRYISEVAPSVYRACIDFYPGQKNDTPLARMLEK